jgi:hypothetical protein
MGGLDEAIDFATRVNVRHTPPLAVPKVIRRGQFMPIVFKADVSDKAADGLQPVITLCHRRSQRGPCDHGFGPDVRFTSSGGKAGKASQEIFVIEELEAGRPAKSKIPLHRRHHGTISGQGWAIRFNKLTSALA